MILRGRRTDDPPDKPAVKWRVALAARKYPVQIALTIALIICAGALVAVERAAEQRLHDAAFAQCRRLQWHRDRDQQFEAAVYAFLDNARVARALSYRYTHDPADLDAAHAYGIIEHAVYYQRPTDCPAAVNSPDDYLPPPPITEAEAIRRHLITPPAFPPLLRQLRYGR